MELPTVQTGWIKSRHLVAAIVVGKNWPEHRSHIYMGMDTFCKTAKYIFGQIYFPEKSKVLFSFPVKVHAY